MPDRDALRRARGLADSQLNDRFAAYCPQGKQTGPDGMQRPAYQPRGSAQGKIQSRSREGDTNTRSVNVGGVERQVIEGGLHLSVHAPAPLGGALGVAWEYELIECGPDTPPELAGSRWLVVDSPAKSYMTARRLDVVRLS